jgi:hypothetical protein
LYSVFLNAPEGPGKPERFPGRPPGWRVTNAPADGEVVDAGRWFPWGGCENPVGGDFWKTLLAKFSTATWD